MAINFQLAGGRFYQNIRRLLAFFRGRKDKVRTPDDLVSFESVLRLDSPEQEVGSLYIDDGSPASPHYRLEVNHFGLLGPHGALPLAYTEWLIDRKYRYGDETAKAFIDIFNHRLLSLRYLAWQKFRLYIRAELEPELPQPGLFTSVTGQCSETRLLSHNKIGVLSSSVRSLVNLQHLLQREFNLPAVIVPFQGRWLDIPHEYQACLGKACLGSAPVVGSVCWDIQSHFLIRLGPLTLSQCQAFMPDTDNYTRLVSLVRLFVGNLLTFSLELWMCSYGVGMTLDGSACIGPGGNLGGTSCPEGVRLYINNSAIMD